MMIEMMHMYTPYTGMCMSRPRNQAAGLGVCSASVRVACMHAHAYPFSSQVTTPYMFTLMSFASMHAYARYVLSFMAIFN
jgi:hypothetical protein